MPPMQIMPTEPSCQHNEVRLRKLNLDSNIIKSEQMRKTLMDMVPEEPVKFKLMYRASKHGFGMKQFHEKCDGVDPTLLIFLSS